jgi:uncharacterized protein (DUF885 family)
MTRSASFVLFLHLAVLPAALPTPALAGTASSDTNAGAQLHALLHVSSERSATLHPLRALQAGDRRHAGRFGEPLSDGYLTQREAHKRDEYTRLLTIDRSALSGVDQLAYDVFRYQLETDLEGLARGYEAIEQLTPLDVFFGPQVSFADLSSGQGGVRYETLQDYEEGLQRIAGFVGWMSAAVARLEEGKAIGYLQPRVVVDIVVRQADEMLSLGVEQSPFLAPVARIPAEIPGPVATELRARYHAAVRDDVLPAYRALRRYLEEEYRAHSRELPGLGDMKRGMDLYEWRVRKSTTTLTSPREIHALGLQEVARIRGAMEEARDAIGFEGDLGELFVHLRTDDRFVFASEDDFIAAFRQVGAHVESRLGRLFATLPRTPYDIRPLPALGGTRGSGYYRPGPPDASAPGVLYVNLTDLRSRPTWQTESLFLHELLPGHHLQNSIARERADLPDLLRFGSYTAYGEGWGLYAESLGRELDLYEDPFQWFGHLDWEMLRAVRLVVDTGLHAFGWSRDRAIEYFLANSAFAPADAAREVDRYISMPAQALAYKVGEMKIRSLRRNAEEALGERFDVREFHAQVLESGALPLAVLEARIGAWIAASR